jgi:hypothetical protein
MRKIIYTVIYISLMSGCSLLNMNIDTGVVPLSGWQINLRNGVHSYAGAMNQYVAETADTVRTLTIDTEIQAQTILWKLGYTDAISKSAFVTDPELALMDTWTFARQHKDFFNSGNGKDLFPDAHEIVLFTADSSLTAIESMASEFYKKSEFETRKAFVEEHAAAEPLQDLHFKRNFILFSWKEFMNLPDTAIVSTVGSLPQVMAEFSDKLSHYSATTPEQMRWQIDLIKQGISSDSTLQAELDSLRDLAFRLVALAERSPDLIDSTLQQLDFMVYRLQRDFNSSVAVLDKSWAHTLEVLPGEREALVKALASEREIILEDINDLSIQVADKAMGHIKGIIRSALIFGIILVLLLFGLPFIGGLYLGKYIQRSKMKNSADSEPGNEPLEE